MSHVRTQIRKAIVAALMDLPTTKKQVFPSRVYPHEKLPALGVYTTAETVVEERMTMGPNRLATVRDITVIVEARVMGPTKTHLTAERFDDQIDDIAAEIEPVMAANETWGGLAQATDYLGVEIEFDDELEQPLALARFNYRVVCSVSTADPTIPS